MKRVVLDTNVTIAAFFWKGHPRAIYDLIRDRKVVMLLSSDIEKEFIRVLCYSKFGLPSKEIPPFIRNLRGHAEFVETTSRFSVIEADHTDNIFLECATDGKADYIISGDKHLLDLGTYKDIQILKAKEFLIKEGFLTESEAR
ncbi:MAG: putative toxin-antitoxin system toxin component, PIN family [Nitrospirota bacterium]|nr:putative toxin-antitoxin system toxin component, PIN family [Nitrospirota bacterium]